MPRLLVEFAGPDQQRDRARSRVVAGWDVKPLELEGGVGVNFAAQWRRCSKSSCSECPHGPYAYAVVGSGSSKRRIYLGALPKGSALAPAPKARRSRGRR